MSQEEVIEGKYNKEKRRPNQSNGGCREDPKAISLEIRDKIKMAPKAKTTERE